MTTIDEFNRARAVGFSPARAARWAAYVAMKLARGEKPITLGQAVIQAEAAKGQKR